ncbi:tape measure protein [Dyadobacter chenhuakuii]|uniref:Tape measure protein n=1 Tax=Dyadobacter chenhuakuii TaxID=2909339 RepID=A0A9X1QCA4_9BACT|nr:tape measure protein [Dyadobacter chenhuakuii]MCF2498404.1 tape measure protein [Dyadobacter chenhuakuii]
MNNRNGALSFDAYIGDTDFNRTIQSMTRNMSGLANNAVSETERIDHAFKRLGQVAAGYLTFTNLAQLPGQIIKVRGEFQQLEIALNTMLGSKFKADKLMGEIIQTAASTPFGLKDLATGTKQLLAYGSASGSVVGEIRMLGDVASGVSVPINDLIYLYGTLRSQGRAYAVDIRQFAGRGIPIYAELAKVLGVQKEEVNALVEAGKVGFPQVEQAFRNMTSAGGMFSGLMEAQSKSLPGLIERLSDAVDQMYNNIGTANQELAEGVIQGASVAIEHYQDIIDILTVIVATYGAYKAAVMVVTATKAAEATSALAVAAAINSQSGAYAREIALKVKSSQASANRAKAAADEAWAKQAEAAATVQSLRAEVTAAAAKKASAIESARSAAAEITAANARLAAAQANQIATANYLSASVRNAAAKEVELAQNAALIASENGVAARKAASAASSDFLTKKTALEAASKAANSLVTNTNSTAAAANTAAKTANAVATARLTSFQALQIAVTRQLTAVQTAFNASLLANPIVLAATAIVGLAAAMWALNDSTSAQEHAQSDLNKITEDAAKKTQDLENKTFSLNAIVRDETQTRYAQLKAFSDLQKIYPGILGQMKMLEFQALSTAEAQKLLNAALEGVSKADSKSGYETAIKKVSELEGKLKGLRDTQAKAGQGAGGLTVPIEMAKKELDAARINAEKLGAQIKENERLEWLATAPPEVLKKHYEDIVGELEKQRSEVEKSLSSVKGMVPQADGLKRIFSEMRLIQLNKDLIDAKGHLEGIGKESVPGAMNKAYWEKKKTDAQGSLDALPISQRGSSEWKKQASAIAEADQKLQAYNTTAKKVAEKDKPQPFGSIAYWEQIARKSQEVIDKTNPKTGSATIKKQQEVLQNAQLMAEQSRLNLMPYGSLPYWEQVQKIANQIISNTPLSNVAEIDKQKRVIGDAQEKADEIRKQLAVRSFDEELEYKRSQYELFEKWVQHLGEDVAKSQFESLIANGGSLVDYLDAEIKKLEKQQSTDGIGLIAPETQQLQKLKEALSVAKGDFTPMEKFNKQLDAARESSGSLTEELIKLKAIQAELDPTDNSSTAVAQRQALAERNLEVQKERKRLLQEFLGSVVGSEQKRLEITNHYADLRTEIEAKNLDKTSAGYIKMMAAIDEKERKELQNFSTEALVESKGYKELEQALALTKRNDTGKRLDLLRKQLAGLTEGTDEYVQKLKEVKDAEEDHRRKGLETWGAIAGMVGEIGSSLEHYGGAIGEIGGALSGLASAASRVSSALSNMESYKTTDGKMSMDGYVAAAQNVIQIITGIIDAQKRRREAEKQFAAERIGFENEYALQLNKSLGTNYKSNPFYQDYDGMIKAGVDQYGDAVEKYQAAIDKLEEGRAKKRQKNVVDGKTTLGMVGAGAAAGAVIGGVVGGGVLSVPAAAVGAIVGGAVGLIGGIFSKKKKDVFGSLMEEYPELVKETADGWAELNVEMANALLTNNQVDDKTKELLQNAVGLNEAMQDAKQQIEDTMIDLSGQVGDNLKNSLVEAFRAGKSEAEALHATVGDIIADITSKLLFSKLVGPALDQLVSEMTQSLTTGDGAIVDDLVRFDQYGLPAVQQYFQGLEEFDEWAKNKGFDDVFGRSKGQDQAMQGVIKGVSEETVSVLIGQFNAVRIYQAQMAFDVRTSLLYLSNIEVNTRHLTQLNLLVDVIDRLERLNATSVRGFGL